MNKHIKQSSHHGKPNGENKPNGTCDMCGCKCDCKGCDCDCGCNCGCE